MSNQHSSTDTEFVALRRHADYYLPGGDLYFLVEHDQYRIHRFFFERESAFFRGKLAAPAPPGGTRQGSSESSAIVLDNVRSADFAKFLWVFYNPKYSVYQASPEEWIAILDLAFRWAFPEVKSLAVRELEKLDLDVIDRIVAYHKYDVDRNLLVNDYAALCQREMPLTLPEGMRLGMETTLNVARARECARSQSVGANGLRSPTSIQVKAEELHSLVVDMFSIPAPDPLSPSAVTDAQPRVQTASTQNGTKQTQEASASKSQPPTQKAQANPSQQPAAPPVPTKAPQTTGPANTNASANGTTPAANGNGVTSNGTASTTQSTQNNGQTTQDNKASTTNGNGPAANGNGSALNAMSGSITAPGINRSPIPPPIVTQATLVDATTPSDSTDGKLAGDSASLNGAGKGRGGGGQGGGGGWLKGKAK